MSSTDTIAPMPGSWPSLWRAIKRGYAAEPSLISVSFGLAMLSAIPDALLALLLKLLANGVLAGRPAMAIGASIGLGVSVAATWFLRVISDRTQRRFRDRITIALESQVAHLQASVASIEHHERPEFLDRLAMLRNQVFVLDHMYSSFFTTCGWVLRLAITLWLLVTIHPALGLLAVFAIPTVMTSAWRPAAERKADESGTQANRLARHLFDLATTAAPGKEVRVTRIGLRLAALRRETWEKWYGPVAKARFTSAAWYSVSWAVFGCAYVGAVAFVSSALRAKPGDVLLVLAAGARLSAYVGATVGEIGFLRGFWLDGARRLAWLEDYAASIVSEADRPAPERLTDGVRFEHVSFAYPGTDRVVLDDVNLHLRAGSVIAVVGENGAGKTTLVKLLCGLYRPTSGRITVDGADLAHIAPDQWRARLAGAFQDFFRFEFRARSTVGLGDLVRAEEDPAVGAAVFRAGADDVIEKLPARLDTQLGPTWPEGVDLSFGQWQKLALARGFMREHPLVLVLDEPTAALDAETEQSLFDRYAAASREHAPEGRITILVSHRFSTVRMADSIVVLDGARVVETGTHEELMRTGGPYSELYGIQAAAYR
jgi:ATP-binding cassette subfamily B protein